MDNGENTVEKAISVLRDANAILVFTGAGISTESGIPDFRGPNGLWSKVDPNDFTIERFLTEPSIRIERWRMHINGERWGARSGVEPNRGHHAVVDLWKAGRLAGVVTQNIDGLHLEAGLPEEAVAEVHGNIRRCHCLGCGKSWPTEEILERVDAGDPDPRCEHCGGIVKTEVVMFGENLDPLTMIRSREFLERSDSVLVLGSTVGVWPAAQIVFDAAAASKPIVIINQGPTEADHLASARIEGPIGETLPEIVSGILEADPNPH